MKKALIVRYGAYGDMLMITPVIKRLKELGYYVILDTTERGREIFLNNPNIDEVTLLTSDEIGPSEIEKYWEEQKSRVNPDYYKNFSESIEVSVALHPQSPRYTYPKKDRRERCNINYYEHTEKWADIGPIQKRGELFFTLEEEAEARRHLKPGMYNILWCLSGSGKNKAYPWSDYVIGEILKNHSDAHIITVGDLKCQLLESIEDDRITNLSGRIPMRISTALTKFVDLVISPDTGVLHSAGCYPTPKIGLLGHTTIENITKHFQNDFSIEAKVDCAPCFRLIYDHSIQCPLEPITHAAWCMAEGLDPKRVYEQFKTVYDRRALLDLSPGQVELSLHEVKPA